MPRRIGLCACCSSRTATVGYLFRTGRLTNCFLATFVYSMDFWLSRLFYKTWVNLAFFAKLLPHEIDASPRSFGVRNALYSAHLVAFASENGSRRRNTRQTNVGRNGWVPLAAGDWFAYFVLAETVRCYGGGNMYLARFFQVFIIFVFLLLLVVRGSFPVCLYYRKLVWVGDGNAVGNVVSVKFCGTL